MWCLGDVVGYGADPDACVELVREHADLCLAGNHDLGVIGTISVAEFSEAARRAAEWTQGVITRRDARVPRVARRPRTRTRSSACTTRARAIRSGNTCSRRCRPSSAFDVQPQRISVVGHTHVALAFNRLDGEGATGETRRDGDELDLSGGYWLLNPGSVGQPRDGDPRAAWMQLDTESLDSRTTAACRIRHRRRRLGDPSSPASRLAGRAAERRAVACRRAAGRAHAVRQSRLLSACQWLKSDRGWASQTGHLSLQVSALPCPRSSAAAAAVGSCCPSPRLSR